MSLSAAALRSLALWEHQLPFLDGLAFEPLLRRCRLDYSPASLGRLDVFLDALRSARKPVEAEFAADPAQRELLHLIAFYAGEVVGRGIGTSPVWLDAAQATTLAPQQPLPGDALQASLSARFGRAQAGDDALFLPLVPICQRLFAPADEAAPASGLPSLPSLLASAERWWPTGWNADPDTAHQPLPPLPGRPWPPALPDVGGDPPSAIDPHSASPYDAALPESGGLESPESAESLNARAIALLRAEGDAYAPEEARALWERAAAQGHAESMNHLGTLIAKGIGGPPDPKVAMDHYRRAAEQGLAAAQLNMARMHLQHDGFAPDMVEAERWLRLAAAQGSPKAQQLIQDLELDRPASPITPRHTSIGELADSVVGWLRERKGR